MIASVLPTYNRARPSFRCAVKVAASSRKRARPISILVQRVAVTSCGHGHPHLVSTLIEQAQKIWHTSNLYRMPGQREAGQHRLIERSFADTVFFCNSGAEALECTIKMARKFHFANGQPERTTIITFEGAFHGRTLAHDSRGRPGKISGRL